MNTVSLVISVASSSPLSFLLSCPLMQFQAIPLHPSDGGGGLQQGEDHFSDEPEQEVPCAPTEEASVRPGGSAALHRGCGHSRLGVPQGRKDSDHSHFLHLGLWWTGVWMGEEVEGRGVGNECKLMEIVTIQMCVYVTSCCMF